MEHVTQEQLEAFVLGTSNLRDHEAFRQHVSSCSMCGQRLEREARLEVVLQQAALEVVAHPGPAQAARFATWSASWRVAAALAALAAGVWLLASLRGPTTPPPEIVAPSAAEFDVPCWTDPMAASPASTAGSPADYRVLLEAPVGSGEEYPPGFVLPSEDPHDWH